jgi:hypothetical protein
MVDTHRPLQRESCEWQYGKMCCITIQKGVTVEPTEFVGWMKNTVTMFPNTY